jgi:hypothetical protein
MTVKPAKNFFGMMWLLLLILSCMLLGISASKANDDMNKQPVKEIRTYGDLYLPYRSLPSKQMIEGYHNCQRSWGSSLGLGFRESEIDEQCKIYKSVQDYKAQHGK